MTLFENFFNRRGESETCGAEKTGASWERGEPKRDRPARLKKIWGQAQMSLLTNQWGEARPRVEALGEQGCAKGGRRALLRGESEVEAVGELGAAAREEAAGLCSAPILLPSSFSKHTSSSGSYAQFESTQPIAILKKGCLLLQPCGRCQERKNKERSAAALLPWLKVVASFLRACNHLVLVFSIVHSTDAQTFNQIFLVFWVS